MATNLLDLPLELRLVIYEALGAITEVRIGFPQHSQTAEKGREEAVRNQSPFAILQTCRQISAEAKIPLWNNIHFIFAHTFLFAKTLASLPQKSRESIRYVTFHGTNFQFDHSYPTFSSIRWPEAVSLFPGLQLVQLTVFDADNEDYETGTLGGDKLDDVAFQNMNGEGWKVLNFITPKVRLLMKEQFRGIYSRDAGGEKVYVTHETWDTRLKRRDMDESASVKFYMVKKEYTYVAGAVLHPEKREQVLDRDEHVFEYFAEKDFWSIYPAQWNILPDREVLVTMRRGATASYVVQEDYSSLFDVNPQNFVKEHGWEKILAEGWLKGADKFDYMRYMGWMEEVGVIGSADE
jgi:hypothetical protein